MMAYRICFPHQLSNEPRWIRSSCGSPRTRRALSLIETTGATLLTAIVLVTSLSTFSFVSRAVNRVGTGHTGSLLAQLLMMEILEKHFAEPNAAASARNVLGREADEVETNRQNWDDVDDYHNVKWTTITSPDGRTISMASGWQAQAQVEFVSETDPNVVSRATTTLKRITLQLTDREGRSYSYAALRSESGLLSREEQQTAARLRASIHVEAKTRNRNWVTAARFHNQQQVSGGQAP